MPVSTPTIPPVSSLPSMSPVQPTAEALAIAVRQHGALGARLVAEYWRRDYGTSPRIDEAVSDAIPALRSTSVRDVALARREPAPFPADVSGGPLDDLFSSPAAMSEDREALQRAAHEARSFGQCLGAEIVTHGARGLDAVDDAVTQFAARHVDELMRMGETASEAVQDLPRILAGEPDTLAERQRKVILRLLSPREGERFHGMRPGVRTALALAVLADDSMAGDRSAGSKAVAIADLVGIATPIADRISGGAYSGATTSRTSGVLADASAADQSNVATGEPETEVEEPGVEPESGGHSL
ncbi:MAG: hypothetical protein ACR2M1_07570 [Gemmatimonadaceae bacterium]